MVFQTFSMADSIISWRIRDIWSVDGNVDARYTDHTSTTETNTLNYLQRAGTFDYSYRNRRNYDLILSTEHNCRYEKEQWSFWLNPKFSFGNQKERGENTAATFRKEIRESTARSSMCSSTAIRRRSVRN